MSGEVADFLHALGICNCLCERATPAENLLPQSMLRIYCSLTVILALLSSIQEEYESAPQCSDEGKV